MTTTEQRPTGEQGPIELRTALQRPFVIGSTLWALLMLGLTFLAQPVNRMILLAVVLAMVAMMTAMVLWMSRRRIRLGEHQLTLHLVPRSPRIDRDDIAEVRVVRQGFFSIIQVIHRDRHRTMLNVTDRERNAQRNAAAIRRWAGIDENPRRTLPAEPSHERQWSRPRPQSAKGFTAYFLVQAAVVCLATLWTTVPWHGWVGAAVSVVLAVLFWRRSAEARVRLEGDELVVEGPRPWRVRARDVVRVVTVSSDGTDRQVLETTSGQVRSIAWGDEGEARAATVQQWAREHGGGLGSDEVFVPPRHWDVAVLKAAFMLSAGACINAVTGGRVMSGGVVAGVTIGVVLFSFWGETVVRDWSDE